MSDQPKDNDTPSEKDAASDPCHDAKMERMLRDEEAISKLEMLCQELETDYGWSPKAVTQQLATLACFRVQYKTPEEEKAELRRAVLRLVLNFFGKGPGRPRNLGLFRQYHPKTEELIAELEAVTDRHMLTYKLRNRQPIYKAYAHLLFQTLVDEGIDLQWQDGLRGLFHELYPNTPKG